MNHVLLLQFLITVVTYSIIGLVVGVGIVLVRQYPKTGEFLKQHPILGWTSAFTLGSVAVTAIEGALIFFLRLLMR